MARRSAFSAWFRIGAVAAMSVGLQTWRTASAQAETFEISPLEAAAWTDESTAADDSAADAAPTPATPASSTPQLSSAAPAATCCDAPCSSCDCCACQSDPILRLFPQDRWLSIRGWLDAGSMINTESPVSRFNGPYNAIDRNEGMFNQAYLIFEHALRNDCGCEFGGRIDLLYGFDYFLAQSTGLEVNPDGTPRWNSSQYYGLAMPQAYGEFGNRELSLKVGHFYSIVGYEGVQAPTNFFYSKAYSYQFAGPFTHWGGLATWNADDNWQMQLGLTNGWNSLDGQQDHVSYLAGAKYTSDCKDWWASFAITTGQEPNNEANLAIVDQYANRTRYSFLFDKQLCNCTEYVFHQWLGVQQDGAVGGGSAPWYGIDQYLYRRLNDCHKLGLRAEWFRDEDGTRVGLNRPSNPNKPPLPGNYYSLSVGDNWTPCANLLVRPELRWDFYNGTAKPYDDGTKENQLLLGFDAIYQF